MDDKEFGRLIQSVKDIKGDLSEIKDLIRAQNGRVRRLEINQAKILSVAGFLAIVIPVLFKILA